MARPSGTLLHTTCIGLSILLSFTVVRAQEEQQGKGQQPPIFHEAINLIVADDTTKSRVDFNFNIPSEFFVFVRSESNPNDFVARGEISVEIFDSQDVSVARDIIHKELHESEEVTAESKKRAPVKGNFSFTLTPGSYHALFEVNDLESKRRFEDRDPSLTLKGFGESAQVFSTVLFLNQLEIENDSVAKAYPVDLGGDAVFGKNFTVLFQSTGDRDTLGIVRYSINKLDTNDERVTVLEDSVRPNPRLGNCSLEALGGDSILVYLLRPKTTGIHVNTYTVQVQADTLQWGRYDIEVRGSGENVSRKSFAIRWLDMARTLRNAKLATDALQYLMSENEFDDFMGLSNKEKRKAFEDFWKKRDPTPLTAYNEAMAEYYSRCDHAMESFSTLSQANGTKTDRGRIYILYGPPTRTDRVLNLNTAPQETWYYDAIQIKFVFVDQSRSGNYKLFSSEKL
jgi:GWxTD domain-containing protein